MPKDIRKIYITHWSNKAHPTCITNYEKAKIWKDNKH